MGFFDDLKDRISSGVASVAEDAGNFLIEQVTDPLVKVGDPLSPADIAAGRNTSGGHIAPPNAAPAQVARAAQTGDSHIVSLSVPMLIGIGIGAYLLFGRRGK